MQAGGSVVRVSVAARSPQDWKTPRMKATIVAADWWLLAGAGGVVLEAFGLDLGALWRSLGGSWEPLCSHWVPLGAIDQF